MFSKQFNQGSERSTLSLNFEKHRFIAQNCRGYILDNFWKHLEYFFVPTSGPTDHNDTHQQAFRR